jgi:hypothetical protein
MASQVAIPKVEYTPQLDHLYGTKGPTVTTKGRTFPAMDQLNWFNPHAPCPGALIHQIKYGV